MDITNKPQRKILRSPSVKRKSKVLPVDQRVKLERVLGITVSTNSSLACDPNNGVIAYPAGCVTVLFNPQRNKQTHLFNSYRKFISAVSFSRDGKYLVTGENGHQPAVRVWDVAEKTQVAELLGHKFGVNCVTFSPNMKELVSVGTQHDKMIIVWNWKSGDKIASNKVSSKVSSLSYSEDGKCFVTVGNRHVRFWYLEDSRSKINQTVPLAGRSGILGEQKDNFFCDVVSGKGKMSGRFFVITQSGLLCEINEKRMLDKWVELRTRSANCLTSSTEHIFVGCAEGVVRVFNATTLHYLCSLPKPHHLGVEITTATTASHMVSGREDANYPDTKCIAFDDDHKKVTCVYNDHSMYIWDVHDLKRVGKAWSFLYHSGCIWALEVYPQLEDGVTGQLPPGSFLTGSRDDTIRVWNLNTHMPENTAYKRNIYSNELLKIIYSDPTLTCLTEVDYNPAGGTDKTDTKYDDKNGVRSIRVSPDGKHLASGDRQGNIRIYDTKYLNEIRSVEAHDSDIMCLEYSYSKYGQFLATASRDRLIHVFDVEANYGLLQTLGDHSSSITAVRFTDNNDKLGMISCGADKSILLRNAVVSPEFQFQLEHHLATKLTLYDMVIDPTQRYLATACQDRNVRLYNIQSRKEKKCYRGSVGDDGILLRIHLDPSGSFAATACTDKSICIVDFETGDLIASMYGHSETITAIKFANDLKHLISVSADGCIFVWRLPSEMTTQIKSKLQELGKEMKDTDYLRSDSLMMPNPILVDQAGFDDLLPVMKAASVGNIPMTDDDSIYSSDYRDGEEEETVNPLQSKKPSDDSVSAASLAYRFSIGQLPNWAKSKFGDGGSEGSESSQEMAPPKGRWAQRLDRSKEFKSQLDLTSEDDHSSDRQHNLSSQSHTSLNQIPDLKRQTMVLRKPFASKGIPIIGDEHRASTGDLSSHTKREFTTPTRSDTFICSRPNLSCKKLSDRFDMLKGDSLDLDDDLDTGSDTTEVIYPPTDLDSDFYASSYQVFATDEDKKSQPHRSSSGIANLDDVASESTDPISLEEEEDGTGISNPTTPSDPEKDFLPWDPDKEDFVKENFEEDFKPVNLEQFHKSLDDIEKNMIEKGSVDTTPFNLRLSHSARFMSRAQSKTNASTTGAYRADNWFNRNKMEMSRAMDETRKSLLAMNVRSPSPEDNDDSPSPPIKLDKTSFKAALYSTSPPAGQLDDQNHDLGRSSGSGPLAKKINKERERRRSSRTSDILADSSNSPKSVAKNRPSYFKPTQSSKNKVNRDMESTSSSLSSSPSRNADKRKSFPKTLSKMPSSKQSFYASSPNLADLALSEKEDEKLSNGMSSYKASKVRTAKMNTSNLKALADLSRSVPDINDTSSTTSTDSGSIPSQPQRKSVFGAAAKITSRYVSGLTDKEKMPPPHTNINSSKRRPCHDSKERRSSGSTSELTLDEAKSILLGKSGILASKSSHATFTVAPVLNQTPSSTSSNLALSSNQSDDLPVFEPTPSQLAMAEEIEHTANMLRHQTQANMSSAYSSAHSNLEASPLDLPERDGPPLRRSSKTQGSVSSLLNPSASSTPGMMLYSSSPSSQPSHISTSTTHTHSNIQGASGGPITYDDSDDSEEKRQSVRDRIARLNTSTGSKNHPVSATTSFNSKSGRMSSPVRRVLPASPHLPVGASEAADSSRISSDTGLGSESEVEVTAASSDNLRGDRSRLALPLSKSPSPIEQVRSCKLALDDLRSQLSKLKDLFVQVDGRTDETSRVILTMMGQAFHEAQSTIMELAARTPSSHNSSVVPSQPSPSSLSTPSTSSPKGKTSLPNTFQSSAIPSAQGSSCSSSSSSLSSSSSSSTARHISNPSSSLSNVRELTSQQMAALSATKEILEPFVTQLSEDLSQGILQIIREKLGQTSQDSSV